MDFFSCEWSEYECGCLVRCKCTRSVTTTGRSRMPDEMLCLFQQQSHYTPSFPSSFFHQSPSHWYWLRESGMNIEITHLHNFSNNRSTTSTSFSVHHSPSILFGFLLLLLFVFILLATLLCVLLGFCTIVSWMQKNELTVRTMFQFAIPPPPLPTIIINSLLSWAKM